MKEFKNAAHKALYEKMITTVQSDNPIGAVSVSGEQRPQANFTRIAGYIESMKNTADNPAAKPILSNRRILGRTIIFFKRAIRKCLKWYIQPICDQQTEFNRTVLPAIGNINEIDALLYEKVNSLEQRITEQEESAAAYADKVSANIERLTNVDNTLKEQQTSCAELSQQNQLLMQNFSAIAKKMEQLDELHLFHEDNVDVWNRKSTAQSGEDCILAYLANGLNIPLSQCDYIDLGANHAKDLSNTYFFYCHGAKGVLVEANPQLIPELKFYRNGDLVVNKCIDIVSGEKVNFHILSGDGLSTPDLQTAQEYIGKNPSLSIVETVEVETISVNDVMDVYMGKAPVILNIDIEGKDLEILQSVDFEKYRPAIVVCEMIQYQPTLVVENKNQKIVAFMNSKDYLEYAFTGINSIFLDRRSIKEICNEHSD